MTVAEINNTLTYEIYGLWLKDDNFYNFHSNEQFSIFNIGYEFFIFNLIFITSIEFQINDLHDAHTFNINNFEQ